MPPDPNTAVRQAWQMEHWQAVQQANQAAQTAILTAQIEAGAQAQSRASLIAALQTHLAALGPVTAGNPDAAMHLAAAEGLATQLT